MLQIFYILPEQIGLNIFGQKPQLFCSNVPTVLKTRNKEQEQEHSYLYIDQYDIHEHFGCHWGNLLQKTNILDINFGLKTYYMYIYERHSMKEIFDSFSLDQHSINTNNQKMN